MDQTLSVANDLWSDVRNAEYLNNMIERIVEHLLDDIGDRKLAELATAIGYDKDYLTQELKQTLPGTLGNEHLMEYLEQRIRADLDDFYSGDEFAAALA